MKWALFICRVGGSLGGLILTITSIHHGRPGLALVWLSVAGLFALRAVDSFESIKANRSNRS